VIVTGGGIGGAACRRFAAAGSRVAVLDIDSGAAGDIAAQINGAGGTARPFPCDITDYERVSRVVAEVESQLGPIGALVNNAGWDVFCLFVETEPKDSEKPRPKLSAMQQLRQLSGVTRDVPDAPRPCPPRTRC
jgi:2-hydroxycyclohexanecarboxyl-CoA dehydrogenase